MAEGLNKVILIGNLGADPELRFTQNQQAVLRLRLATNESFVNKNRERQERTEWHTVVVWGNRAEALNKILSKGRALCVEGRLQTRQWEDRDGNKRSTTEVVANNVILLGGGGGGGGGGGRGGGGGGGGRSDDFGGGDYGGGDYGGGRGGGSDDAPPDDFGDDDIPF